jgi:hypothetical protein
MKKSILVILILILPSVMAYAKPPVEPECGDGVCNGPETCSSCPADCGVCPTLEIIPKVIDANGKFVGYVLSADTGEDKTVVLGMEYYGKKFKAKMKNGQFDTGPDIFYESTDCSGTGYVQFNSPESIANNCLCFGLFIGNIVYVPAYGGPSAKQERTAYSRRNNIGQCTSGKYTVYWAYPYQPAFDWRVEFLPPFKMVYDNQAQ